MNALLNELEGQLETIKSWRHHLHKHPELSLEESKTAKYIAELERKVNIRRHYPEIDNRLLATS